jgi:GR25 family glycosyltransferase involved in LPS biosynthesis
MFKVYYKKFIYNCAYCCVFVEPDAVSKKLAPLVGTFMAGKPIIHNQTISDTNCSLQRHLTLKEIGIKKIFLINLDRRIDRLSHVLKMLGYLRLPYTRFSAIDARKIREEMKKFDRRTNFIRNISSINKVNGATGAWQSHLQIYFKIVGEASKNDRPVLILEDDLDMEVNTSSLLQKALSILPNDWEMFFLGHSRMSCKKVYENNICRAHLFTCTFAYVIRNSTVAKKLIKWSNTERTQVADLYWQEYIVKDLLVAYAAYPNHIIIQDRVNFGTDITSGPLTAMKLQNPLSKMIQ